MKKGMLLKIQIEGDNAQLESELIGTESDKLLIIKIPPIYTVTDTSKLIYKGNSINVRYPSGGSLLGFQSQIIDFDNEKSITIDYPKEIENYELRRSRRIDCFLPVKVKTGSNVINGNILNISKEGCLITIDSEEIEEEKKFTLFNTKLDISFHLPQVEEVINVAVAQKNFAVSNQGIRIGAEYVDMEHKSQTTLNNFLLKALG